MNNKLTVLIIATVILVSSTALYPSQEDELTKSKERGKALYEELCVTCHLADGTGTEAVFPPLAKSDYLMKNKEGSIRAIKYGQEGEIKVNGVVYNNIMPAPGLNDQEVADLMNYIQNSWGNKGKYVTADEIAKVGK
jgi:mono/diheme cytochrome c family protein